MARRGYPARRAQGTPNEDAVEHMRQRRELSRLVQGIDNDVLDIFFRMDSATFTRLAITYEQLFGADEANYMRRTLPAWRSGATGVSGRNAARLLIAVPLFLSDTQRATLLTKMRRSGLDEQAVLWLEGQHSAVRDGIKTVAGRGTGRALPTLPAKKPSKPAQPQFLSNVVIDGPPAPRVVPTTLQDLPRNTPSPPASPAPAAATRRSTSAANKSPSGCAVAFGAIAILGFVFLVALGSSQPTSSRQSVYSAQTGSGAPATTIASTPNTYADLSARSAMPRSNPSTFYPSSAIVPATPSPTVQVPAAAVPNNLEVKFVRKSSGQSSHGRITHIGGMNADGSLWALSEGEAIAGLQSGKYRFFVSSGVARVEVRVATSRVGNLMLKSAADGRTSNNLVSLPDFPR